MNLSVVALLALVLSEPAAGQAPPDQAILDAFRSACSRVGDLDQMHSDIARFGFEAVAETADPRLERLNEGFRAFVADRSRLAATNFRTTIGGRTLYLYVAHWEDDQGRWGNSCRLHDFDAAAPVDAALLERWVGRPPSQVQDQGEIGVRLVWEPAWQDGTELDVIHVPQWRRVEEPGITGNVMGLAARSGY